MLTQNKKVKYFFSINYLIVGSIHNANLTYYQRNKEQIKNKAKEYYQKNKEWLSTKAREKYRTMSKDEKRSIK